MKRKFAGWLIIGVTAVFLVFCVGYFFGTFGKNPVIPMPAEQSDGYEQKQPEADSEIPAVNLNTATAEELMQLPGIGEKTAAAILAYRETNGAFKTIWQLDAVEGIGEKTMAQLEPYLTVS